jgi:hypothetical protein
MEGGKSANRGIGLGIGVTVLLVLVLVPALIVVGFYVFASVDALIVGSDFSSDTVNVPVLLTGLVLTVALFAILLAVVVGLIGRALSPKRDDDLSAL